MYIFQEYAFLIDSSVTECKDLHFDGFSLFFTLFFSNFLNYNNIWMNINIVMITTFWPLFSGMSIRVTIKGFRAEAFI